MGRGVKCEAVIAKKIINRLAHAPAKAAQTALVHSEETKKGGPEAALQSYGRAI